MKLNTFFNQITDAATRRALWKMQEGINDLAGLPVGQEKFLVANKTTDAFFLSLIANGCDPAKIYDSFVTAEAAMTTGRGDTLNVMPGNHSLAADPTIAQNMSIFRGKDDWPMMNKRCRLGMSTAFSPFITVSGYGNLFQNLYSMHGTAAADYIGWLISGERNGFKGMHFGGPMAALQGGHASYEGVKVTGTECLFDGCVFGTQTIGRDEITPNLTVGAGTHTTIKNSKFLAMLTDGDPIFVKVENTSGVTQIDFENTIFSAISENMAVAMTVAFVFTGGSTAIITFDKTCRFINVTNLAATGSMKYLWLPTDFAATADELNLISTHSATF